MIIVRVAAAIAILGIMAVPIAAGVLWHYSLPDYSDARADPVPTHLFPDIDGTQRIYHDRAWRVVSGDTIEGHYSTYRLALVDSPNYDEPGHVEAAAYAESVCPRGALLKINVDDRQSRDRDGRTVAAVWCQYGHHDSPRGPTLNELLLRDGYACLRAEYLPHSEFGQTSWARAPAPVC